MAIAPTNKFQPIDFSNNKAVDEYKDKSILGKDDFMKLMLVELQHQDPTAPMDSEKILSQTSQLATLEASDNTTAALEKLSKSLGTAQQFSNVAAIGKVADLGSDAISYDKAEGDSKFEIYFPKDVYSGKIEISDLDGNVVSTLDIQEQKDENGVLQSMRGAGVHQFSWEGLDNRDNKVDTGIYRVKATYMSGDATENTAKFGAYPIESVRFEGDKTLVKVGSSYVPLEDVVEVY